MLNLIKNLSGEYEFYVFSLNHEYNRPQERLDVTSNEWLDFQNSAKVFYVSKEKINFFFIKKIIEGINPDFIYLNGLYNTYFIFYPIIIAKQKGTKVILAPRGLLQKGTLKLKSFKKKMYLSLFKTLYLQKNVRWHAIDIREIKDIKEVFGKDVEIVRAEDTPDLSFNDWEVKDKMPKELKMVSISLITAKKNINYTLELLSQIYIPITFDIYGPVISQSYWELCKKTIEKLPSNIKVNYFGPVNPALVSKTLEKYHVFIFPTLGENFGHVIYEALRIGLPVIISDKTPWDYVSARNAGFVIPLEDPEKYISTIEELYEMNDKEYNIISRNASKIIEEFIDNSNYKNEYYHLFN